MVLTSRAAMVSAACNEKGSFADQVAKCGPGESTCGPPTGIVLRSGDRASKACACDEASPTPLQQRTLTRTEEAVKEAFTPDWLRRASDILHAAPASAR